ncbi:hypothetical protein [Bradyrhizobium sp. JR3.5]
MTPQALLAIGRMRLWSSHQLEQFEDIHKPQLSAFEHMLEEQVPRIRGNLVPFDCATRGMEQSDFGGNFPGGLRRDLEEFSDDCHARKIGIQGRFCEWCRGKPLTVEKVGAAHATDCPNESVECGPRCW